MQTLTTLLAMVITVGVAAYAVYKLTHFLSRRASGVLAVGLTLLALGMAGLRAKAQSTDAMGIIATVNTDLPTLFGCIISIGTFFVIYRLVRRAR